MKHGIAFRKFSRTSSHRMLMLRNLVASLFEHEQIKTTLPKARDAARLAEKMITLGKQGTLSSHRRASAFLLKPAAVTKLFDTFADRYADRPGGYTRIHKFGHRPGDNAPHAILELVDNPRDLRFEITSRAIGRELLEARLKTEQHESLAKTGVHVTANLLEKERELNPRERGSLRTLTRWNLQKVLRFRPPDAMTEISQKASGYIDSLLAKPMAFKSLQESFGKQDKPARDKIPSPHRLRAGEASLRDAKSPLALTKGALWRPSKFR